MNDVWIALYVTMVASDKEAMKCRARSDVCISSCMVIACEQCKAYVGVGWGRWVLRACPAVCMLNGTNY